MKYLEIYHDGNGEIKKNGLEIKSISKEGLEEPADECLVCRIPLAWIKQKVR